MAGGRSEQDDAELLGLVQGGSSEAFAALVERHAERFYRLAYRYVRSKATAEDLVQEAFLRLWENPDRWSRARGSRFTTWFYRVVVNLCLDWEKKKRPLALAEGFEQRDESEPVDAALVRAEGQRLLEKEIAALPARQRMAVNLCFEESLSNQEAADLMGLGLKALQSLLMRAKTTLRQRMQSYL